MHPDLAQNLYITAGWISQLLQHLIDKWSPCAVGRQPQNLEEFPLLRMRG